MLKGTGACGRVQLQLFLHIMVVGFLQPGAEQDAVVMVTHGTEEGGGGIGKIVCQRELCHQLTKERAQAACGGGEEEGGGGGGGRGRGRGRKEEEEEGREM